MKRIAIFASGSGSNFQRIAEYFESENSLKVCLLVCNKPNAGVIQRAEKLNIPVQLIDKNSLYNSKQLTEQLLTLQINLIVLAGFLWLIPDHLLQAFPRRIINIHPALLPAYGGKGMYGEKVHEAVIQNKECFSGITIHFVNANYDEGDILFQEKFELTSNETPQSLAERIHLLEYSYYPEVIANLLGIKPSDKD